MAFDTTADRALMLGEFCGDGDVYVSAVGAGSGTINLIVGETGLAKSVTINDENDDPIDLVAVGAVRLSIERQAPTRTDLQTCLTSDATITISGSSNEVATFTPNAAVLARKQDLNYAFRVVSSGRVLKSGRVAVGYVAVVDP